MRTWTFKEIVLNGLEAFEMWRHRRILRLSCDAQITIEAVVNRIGNGREVRTQLKLRNYNIGTT